MAVISYMMHQLPTYCSNHLFDGPIKIDYESNSSLVGVYVKLRHATVILSFTPIVVFFVSPERWSPGLWSSMATLVLVYLAIRMVGAVNRNVYARCVYGAVLEETMNYRGFFSCWIQFICRNANDASSHAFVIAAQIVNVLASTLIAVGAINVFESIDTWDYNLRLSAALMFLLVNERYIRTELNEKYFLPRLYAQLRNCHLQPAFTN